MHSDPRNTLATLALASLAVFVSCGDDAAHSVTAGTRIVEFPPLDVDWARIEGVSGYTVGSDQYPPVEVVRIGTFHIATTEVTQALFASVMGANPSIRRGDEHPVENVSWIDAARFCNALSERQGRAPCYDPKHDYRCDTRRDGYRLPTSAEWELACRGSSLTLYPWGDDFDEARCVPPVTRDEFGELDETTESFTHPVASVAPDARGLYDMCGNVAEWCNDVYSDEDEWRVYRGGHWADWTKASFEPKWRRGFPRSESLPSVGFRLVTNRP